jgi:uncharacterized membrane protein YgcG
MLVSLDHARAGTRHLAILTVLVLAPAACSDGDLLLPQDDRTPVQLRAFSGSGQSAVVGSPVPHPLVVLAVDRAGHPVQGVVVVFRFVDPPEGAVIAPPAPATDPEGLASVDVTLGSDAGDQPVEARLDDSESDLRVRFLLTAIRPSGGGGGGGGDDGDGDGGGGGDDGNGGGGEGGDDDDQDEDDDGEGKGGKGRGKGGNAGRNDGD